MGNDQKPDKPKKNNINFTENYLKNLNEKKEIKSFKNDGGNDEKNQKFSVKSNLRNISYISKNWDESFDYCIKKRNERKVLLEINKSKKLNYSEKFEFQKNILVSVLGLKSSGKTFLLNNLNEKIFFDQTDNNLFEEKGLNIRYAKSAESNIIYMECPCYDGFYNEPELNETIEINNKFFVNFCLKYSQLIILVVNELTIEDFYMINLIKLQCSTNQKIIVIHNLIHFLEDNEIENYVKNFFINNKKDSILIQNTFKKAGMFFTDDQNKFYFEENFINPSDNNKEINIIHLVLANYENDENLYYKYTSSLEFIGVIIKECSKSAETFKVKDKLLEFLKENKKFYNFEINNKNEIIYEEKKNKINKIKDIHLNEKISPNFCYYIDKERNKFIVEIETIFNPSDIKINNEKQSGTGVQIITIKFKKEINSENDKELCDIVPQDYDIQLGDCELKLIIPFDKVYFDSSTKTMKFFFENGKIQIEYEIMKNDDDSNNSVVKLDDESEEQSDSNNDREDDDEKNQSNNEDENEKNKSNNEDDDEKNKSNNEDDDEKNKSNNEDDDEKNRINNEDENEKNKSNNEDDDEDNEKVRFDNENDSNENEENEVRNSGNSD